MATDAAREALRTQINQARAAHASLEAERATLLSLAAHRARRPADPAPAGEADAATATAVAAAPLPSRIATLGRELADLEERSVLYRALCGATCFEIDLDTGRRARAARRAALKAAAHSASASAPVPAHAPAEAPTPNSNDPAPDDAPALGLGVRIDTFTQGTVHLPLRAHVHYALCTACCTHTRPQLQWSRC